MAAPVSEASMLILPVYPSRLKRVAMFSVTGIRGLAPAIRTSPVTCAGTTGGSVWAELPKGISSIIKLMKKAKRRITMLLMGISNVTNGIIPYPVKNCFGYRPNRTNKLSLFSKLSTVMEI
jgi:hypothetical protein